MIVWVRGGELRGGFGEVLSEGGGGGGDVAMVGSLWLLLYGY